MTESCACGARAETSCNDCEAPLCDACSAPDFRCFGCNGANQQAASLFDDPECVNINDWDDDESDADADLQDIEAWDIGPDFGGEL